jgi:hypothetical protein
MLYKPLVPVQMVMNSGFLVALRWVCESVKALISRQGDNRRPDVRILVFCLGVACAEYANGAPRASVGLFDPCEACQSSE